MKRKRWFHLMLAAFLCWSHSAGQNGKWVPFQLPAAPGYHVESAVGENCLVFVEDSSNIIKTFDIYSHQWHTFLAPTGLPWQQTAKSGGNTALVYNDSIVVAYSAVTGTFACAVLDSLPFFADVGYGCAHDMAFLVTAHTFYVFDGKNGIWHTHSYVPVSDASSLYLHAEKDYLLLVVVGPIGVPSDNYIVYSQVTNSFAELPGENVNVTPIDGGVLYLGGQVPDVIFGGFSASTGTVARLGPVPEGVTLNCTPNGYKVWSATTCATFTWNELLGGGTMRLHMYNYDTRLGTFTEKSIDWDYNHYPYTLVSNGGGYGVNGFTAVDSGDSVDVFLFNGSTGGTTSWRTWFDRASGYALPNTMPGGRVFLVYGSTIMRWYDVGSLNSSSAVMPLVPFAPYPHFVSTQIGETWGAVVVRPQNDSLCVYSYNAASNNLQSFVRVVHGSDYDFRGRNEYGICTIDNYKIAMLLFYSPLLDTWTEISPGNQAYFGVMGFRDYAFASLSTSNTTIIFDGVTGQQMTLPLCPPATNYVSYRDDAFVMWDVSGNIYGYSPYVHNWAQHTTSQSGVRGGDGAIVAFHNGSWALVYNGLRNSFVEKTLTAAEGMRVGLATGRFTALLTTTSAYIFAFDPEESSSAVAGGTPNIVGHYALGQNYPNPFNPTTTIRYELPHASRVSLKVYNTLGQEVATLVNETKPAGVFTVTFDAGGLASGVYFYRLQAGDIVQVKRLILLK
jgi:hypothetical protein